MRESFKFLDICEKVSFWEHFLTSGGRLGIDFGAQGGHFGDQNDDFLGTWDHLGPFGESLGSPGLPWAAQVRKKRQKLVRGSPKGIPTGGQKGPKSDQNEVQSRKNEGRGPKRRKTEAQVRFGTFLGGFRVEKSEKI